MTEDPCDTLQLSLLLRRQPDAEAAATAAAAAAAAAATRAAAAAARVSALSVTFAGGGGGAGGGNGNGGNAAGSSEAAAAAAAAAAALTKEEAEAEAEAGRTLALTELVSIESLEVQLQRLNIVIHEGLLTGLLTVFLPLLVPPTAGEEGAALGGGGGGGGGGVGPPQAAVASRLGFAPGDLNLGLVMRLWEDMACAPRPTGDELALSRPLYMRMLHIGAVHAKLSYESGGGALVRTLDSLAEAQHAAQQASLRTAAGVPTASHHHYHGGGGGGGHHGGHGEHGRSRTRRRGGGGGGGGGREQSHGGHISDQSNDSADPGGGGGSGGDGGDGGASGTSHGLSVMVRAVAAAGNLAASLQGASLKFAELHVTDAFTTQENLLETLGASYTRQAVRQWYRLLGSADILGNPLGLIDSLGGGVIEFFRAPAQGLLSDGLMGLGLGVQQGTQALVLGAVHGTFDSVSRITGAACKVLESVADVDIISHSHGASGAGGGGGSGGGGGGGGSGGGGAGGGSGGGGGGGGGSGGGGAHEHRKWSVDDDGGDGLGAHDSGGGGGAGGAAAQATAAAAQAAGAAAETAAHMAKGVLTGLGGAVLRPYRGARDGGAVGLGKGLVSGAVGAAITPLALLFGTLTLATGTIASRAQHRKEKVSGEQYVEVAKQRRPRRFGPRGEMQIYGPGAARPTAQRRIDANAALRLQRWFRQRRLRRLGKLKGDVIGSATDSLLNAQRARCGGAGGCCVVM